MINLQLFKKIIQTLQEEREKRNGFSDILSHYWDCYCMFWWWELENVIVKILEHVFYDEWCKYWWYISHFLYEDCRHVTFDAKDHNKIIDDFSTPTKLFNTLNRLIKEEWLKQRKSLDKNMRVYVRVFTQLWFQEDKIVTEWFKKYFWKEIDLFSDSPLYNMIEELDWIYNFLDYQEWESKQWDEEWIKQNNLKINL